MYLSFDEWNVWFHSNEQDKRQEKWTVAPPPFFAEGFTLPALSVWMEPPVKVQDAALDSDMPPMSGRSATVPRAYTVPPEIVIAPPWPW